KELEIRKLLSEKLQRGKVDFSITTETNSVNKAQQINPEIIKAYISEFKQIVPDASDAELLAIVMRLPDVMAFTCKEIDDEEWNQAVELILKAVENLTQFRLDEGKVLEQEFIQRNNSILNLLTQVEPFEKERIQTLKERFIKNLGELTTEYDQ